MNSRSFSTKNQNDDCVFLFPGISWAIASTITALVFMPKFRELNCTSAYEVFLLFLLFFLLQNSLSSI